MIQMSSRTAVCLVAATVVWLGISGSAAGDTFGSSASTGVRDMCDLAGVGGIDNGAATSVAPTAHLLGGCNGSNINSEATASAGIAQGNVVVSGGAFVMGSSHTSASAIGPSTADGRAIFNELLTVAPTAGFGDNAFDVVATYTVDGDLGGQAQAVAELQTTSFFESLDHSSAFCTFDCGVCTFGCDIVVVSDAGAHYKFSIVETIPVLTASPFLFVQTTLDTFAGSTTFPYTDQPGSADFTSTGTLSLTLPDGFTFVSDVNQGVLTPPASVPEPVTFALLLAAAAGLGFARRRARQR